MWAAGTVPPPVNRGRALSPFRTVRTAAAVAAAAVTLLGGCTADDGMTAEERYLEATRREVREVLGEAAPDYTDAELLAFGERACDNLADIDDGEALREAIESSSVGASDTETLQIAQATIVVTTAGTHLCPDQGERLGITADDPEA